MNIRSRLSTAIASQYFPFFVTVSLFIILYIAGIMNYRGFTHAQVFYNLFIDNAPLIIVTVGVTFTLLIGGIDLSVGSVVALVCMSLAYLLKNTSIPVFAAVPLVLLIGIAVGFIQGYLITMFDMQPFIITLAGMFFCRGLTAVISRNTIIIDNPAYAALASERIRIFDTGFISVGAIVAIIVLILATIFLKYTKTGRTIFAIGGSESSASLMGLPVFKTKILVYIISGFCSALAGIVYSWIMLSGYTLHGLGMEMDAIASSVIGGTLLTGGVGFMPGTLFGVLIQGIILTFITFQGTLSAWWTKIVVGALLCVFIIMQALITEHKNKLSSSSSIKSDK
ncbi:galactofuranose ABC transporter, permease protein YjfF [Pectinatus brassicae]|uniref:Simple sugar transport system permease protein n=1 Tax=Pectinatus brassicae TaxID=862415 RepID=A0A840URK5_9FIRM|nr:galactofuranose ABC transporter, permease protein YjfF [Pectinatus brassicae]MBB5335175.1 simple sugar transport system permease protein [Pectinatus brassicae]